MWGTIGVQKRAVTGPMACAILYVSLWLDLWMLGRKGWRLKCYEGGWLCHGLFIRWGRVLGWRPRINDYEIAKD